MVFAQQFAEEHGVVVGSDHVQLELEQSQQFLLSPQKLHVLKFALRHFHHGGQRKALRAFAVLVELATRKRTFTASPIAVNKYRGAEWESRAGREDTARSK